MYTENKFPCQMDRLLPIILPQRFFFLSHFVPEPIWMGRKTSPLTDIICISFISNLLSKNILTRTVNAYIHIYWYTQCIYIHTYICSYVYYMWASLVTQTVRNRPAMQDMNECVCMYMRTNTHTPFSRCLCHSEECWLTQNSLLVHFCLKCSSDTDARLR